MTYHDRCGEGITSWLSHLCVLMLRVRVAPGTHNRLIIISKATNLHSDCRMYVFVPTYSPTFMSHIRLTMHALPRDTAR